MWLQKGWLRRFMRYARSFGAVPKLHEFGEA